MTSGAPRIYEMDCEGHQGSSHRGVEHGLYHTLPGPYAGHCQWGRRASGGQGAPQRGAEPFQELGVNSRINTEQSHLPKVLNGIRTATSLMTFYTEVKKIFRNCYLEQSSQMSSYIKGTLYPSGFGLISSQGRRQPAPGIPDPCLTQLGMRDGQGQGEPS